MIEAVSWRSHSVEETKQAAALLASLLPSHTTITLHGEMGAGKTHFTQGLAKGLGIDAVVNSPTFSLVKSYRGTDKALHHMDLYRLSPEEAEELGLEEMIEGPGICVIEWSDRIEDLLPAERLDIVIDIHGPQERTLNVTPLGDRMKQIAQHWINDIHAM